MTNFTSLVVTWRAYYGSRGFIYDAKAVVGVGDAGLVPGAGVRIESCSPNPAGSETVVRFSVSRPARVTVAIFDVLGRRRAVLSDQVREPGGYSVRWRPGPLAGGTYFCRVLEAAADGSRSSAASRAIVVRR